jgi:uncharacterized membrane protein
MATTKDIGSKLAYGIFGGIVGYLLAIILDSTQIFSMIPALPEIGLFLGVMVGAFKDKFE